MYAIYDFSLKLPSRGGAKTSISRHDRGSTYSLLSSLSPYLLPGENFKALGILCWIHAQ